MRPSSSRSEPPAGAESPPDAGAGLFDAVLARGPVRELVGDGAWVRAMLAAEGALATALADAGLAPADEAAAVAAACDEEEFDVAAIGRAAAGAGNPVVPLVRELTARVRVRSGDAAAGWVHHGATSQDVLDTAAVLVTRDALHAIDADLRATADATATLARAHAGTVLAGRTLMQQALPTTFGAKAAGWLVSLDSAAEEVRRVAGRLPAQLGGAAGTLASLGEDGTAVLAGYARSLGLTEPVVPWHTNRLPLLAAATAAALASAALSKVALDVVLLAQTEVGEAVESSPGRGGSSTMPHKRNPVGAVAARAASARVPGLLTTLLAASAHEHERAAGPWHAEWLPLRDLLVATGSASSWTAESLRSLEVDAGRMRDNLGTTHGLLLAERVSTALRPRLGRLAAHDLVEQACRTAVREHRDLLDVLLATPAVAEPLGEDRLRELLDPATYLGSAAGFVRRALQNHAEHHEGAG